MCAHTAGGILKFSTKSSGEIRQDLLERREIALLDVREEAVHAEGHPLFAANLPFSRIELEVYARLPRRNVPIVLFGADDHAALRAAKRLGALGYTDVRLLEGGLQGWRAANGEVFRDVNVPSKAFGELVEAQRHTPSLSAEGVKALMDAGADVVILDVRRFDEFHTMSIPTATSVPGAELVLRARELAPNSKTKVIVNCAGRTRSIIGAQSLINSGLQNPVVALRNGTIGWTLAQLSLDHGQTRRFGEISEATRAAAAEAALCVANRAGVQRVSLETAARWVEQGEKTIYRFDVRTPEEYEEGHLRDFRSAPGGQLVQETDYYAPVRGARIVLADDDGVRANMTSSWLAQMGWDVFVLDGLSATDFAEHGPWQAPIPPFPAIPRENIVSPQRLNEWLGEGGKPDTVVFDVGPSTQYVERHILGAWFALRSELSRAFEAVPVAERYVLTSPDGTAARFAWEEATGTAPFVLEEGTQGWIAHGFPVSHHVPRFASMPVDRYRRPYEGTDVSKSAMQTYLDWEYGLVDQLLRDGTHGFKVI
jgi:rhodanese-related sulfurtransferase